MSNPRSTKKTINLKSLISTSKNHSTPDDSWSNFDNINSPYYNEGLSPLYYKEENNATAPTYDRSGNKWYIENGSLYKNSDAVMNVDSTGFKKTVFENGYSSFIKHGNDYYGSNIKNGFITLYKNDTEITVRAIGEATVLTDRLVYGNHGLQYIALLQKVNSSDNLTVEYSDDVKKWYSSSVQWRNGGYTATAGVTLGTPMITYHSYSDCDVFCIVSHSGANIDSADVYTYTRVYTSNGFTEPSSMTIGTTTSQQVVDTDTVSFIGNVFEGKQGVSSSYNNDYLENRTCILRDGKYFDTETEEEVTFSEGYTPTLVSGTTYNYTVYHTRYTYEWALTAATIFDHYSGQDVTFNIDLSINDATFPADVPNKDISDTVTFAIDSDGDLTGYYVLDYTSNRGYIYGKSFASPELSFTYPGDNTIHQIPVNAWNISTSYVSQRKTYVYTFTAKYSQSVEKGTDGFDQYIMLDNGYWYGFDSGIRNTYTTGSAFGFRASAAITSSAITLTPDISYAIPTTYGSASMTSFNCNRGTTLNLHPYWFRSISRRSYNLTESTNFSIDTNASDASNVWFMEFDNEMNTCYINPGVTSYTSMKFSGAPGTYDYRFNNTSGARIGNGFDILYNAGYVTGISYGKNEEEGTLLTGWTSVNTDVNIQVEDDFVIFKNGITNKWTEIDLAVNPYIGLVENRYLVANTVDYWNGWDTKLNKKVHYASDWNDRVYFGFEFPSSFTNTYANSTVIYATGENALYNLSEDTLTSAMFPAKAYVQCYVDGVYFKDAYDSDIDYFMSKATEGNPLYMYTYLNGSHRVKSTYEVSGVRQQYPLSTSSVIYYNPSIFTEIIQAGNNIDFMQDDGYSYRLIYDNNTTPILQASSSSYLDNMDGVFVIQSMPYGIMGGKLYSLSYTNGTYSGADAIIDVTGMQLIGAIPSEAFLFSPLNHAIYGFTGDANLTKFKDASVINEIYATWYNTATQTIYFATDDGLYMLNDETMYRQDFAAVQGVYFSDDGSSFVVNKEDDSYKSYHIRYDKENDEWQTNKVKLDTGLYGTGNNMEFIVDRWSISFWNGDHENGTVKVKSQILTDMGKVETEEIVKKIKKEDWDPVFDTILIDCVPKHNKGMGVGLIIESDFEISNIVASVTQDSNTQTARINI